MILARDYGRDTTVSTDEPALKLTEAEALMAESVTSIFRRILNVNTDVVTDGSADFFKMGAGRLFKKKRI